MGITFKDFVPPILYKKDSDIVSKDIITETSIKIGGQYITPELLRLARSASWVSLNNLYNIYINNPVLYAALSINAKYLSSVDVRIRNIKTGEIYSKQSMREGRITDPVAKKMFSLISNPNPLQSTAEFLTMNSITYDLYGNSMTRGNFAFDRYDIKNIATMYNLWPQFMKPIMTGKFLNAIDIKDIISKWEYQLITKDSEKYFNPDEILHRKEPNLTFDTIEDIVLGKSRIIPLQMPLSNIAMAYETRNVISKERGIEVIVSSNNIDQQLGNIGLTPDEEKQLKEAFKKKYGSLEGQDRYMFSPFAVKVDQIDQDIRKLGILEEIGMDAMIVAHVYNIPIELIKMYLQGATYENQGASDRRMYQTNTIPRADDLFEDFNNWLGTRDYGFEYYPSWDHIAVLQADKKETSLVRRNESFVCREAFLAGTITGNEWRIRMGFEKSNNTWFDMYIWEMTDAQVNLITGRNTMMAQNENKPAVNSSSQL